MVRKSVLFWVASLLMLHSLPLLAGGERESFQIEGRVVFKDGEPFSGAIITAVELRGRPFMMPAVKQNVSVVADDNGEFSIELRRVRGTLDIRAKHETCFWRFSSGVTIYPEDLRGKDSIRVDLEATRGDCPELEN
mgnify:CR=1 FL=1